MEQIKDYFKNLQDLLKLEKDEELNQNANYFENTPLKKRVSDGKTWYPTALKEQGFGLGSYPYIIITRKGDVSFAHEFRSGKMVSLFSTKDDGFGLGLSFCYDIIARHRGSFGIKYSSKLGTTFSIRIPNTKHT